jgi:hypothetical protein
MPGYAVSSSSVIRKVNDSVTLTVTLVRVGLPVSGKTPQVKFIRRSDGKFYNWNLNVWQIAPVSKTLVENVLAAGVYETIFNQATADPNSEEDYLGVFTANGAPAVDRFYGTVEYSFKRFAVPGDEMNLTTTAIQAVRSEIMTYVVNGNILGLTTEQTWDLIRKILNNRLELFDGDTNNWKLYDDDDTTLLLQYNVRDKTGASIGSPTGAPARRTRGT